MQANSTPTLTPKQIDRFWSNVEVPYQPSCCWNWEKGKAKNGYGVFSANHIDLKAHRVAFELLIGPIPEGMTLDHLCRNRPCCNPDHMQVVTHTINILRGFGWAAINSRKTHCIHGHKYTAENTYIAQKGGRSCRTCMRRRRKEWKAKRKIELLRLYGQTVGQSNGGLMYSATGLLSI